MHTERIKLFEETYAALSDCHLEIKFSNDLTDFEIDRASPWVWVIDFEVVK